MREHGKIAPARRVFVVVASYVQFEDGDGVFGRGVKRARGVWEAGGRGIGLRSPIDRADGVTWTYGWKGEAEGGSRGVPVGWRYDEEVESAC